MISLIHMIFLYPKNHMHQPNPNSAQKKHISEKKLQKTLAQTKNFPIFAPIIHREIMNITSKYHSPYADRPSASGEGRKFPPLNLLKFRQL
jgi:hypothetical protein